MAKDWKPSPPKFPFDPEHPFDIPEPLGEKQCISPSGINVYDQCDAKFLWSKINKIGGAYIPNEAAELGESIHSWAENMFDRPHTVDEFEKIALQIGDLNLMDSYKQNLIYAELDYMSDVGMKVSLPYKTEIKASTWSNRRVAYIDRTDFMLDGNLIVCDIKPADKRKYPANVRRQLHFYAAQLNYAIEECEKRYEKVIDKVGFEEFRLHPNLAGRFTELVGLRVKEMRVVGYKDASNWMMKLNKRTLTSIETRITAMRTETNFPCKIGNLCKYCEFADNTCMEANMDLW